MQGADKGESTALDGSRMHVAIVQARFNADITDRLAQTCIDELAALGVPRRHIRLVKVPGALEVPVALQALAEADWTPYRGAKVLLKGCGTHPVPDSAYAAAARHLTRVADKLMYGEACSNVPIFKVSGS